VEVKFHPSVDRKLYERSFPRRFSVTQKSLPELFKKARIVVGRGSGSQLEAAVLGIPVIDVLNPSEFSHCCMPEMGRGILWDQATNADDVARIVSKFQKTLQVDPSCLRKEGARIRSCYFSEPTDELIEQMLGLDKTKV
jgi:predicted glycosyltransferase